MSSRRFATVLRLFIITTTLLGVAVDGLWPSVADTLLAFPGLATLALLLGWRRAWPGVAAMNGNMPLPTQRESIPSFEREMGRARRYEHALGVVVLRVDGAVAVPGVATSRGANGTSDYSPRTVGMMLRACVRETDLLAWEPTDGSFVLLLPETGREPVEALASRLVGVVRQRTGIVLRCGTAAFPEHGLILEVLVAHARAGCWPVPVVAAELPSRLESPVGVIRRRAEECC
jgi:GGDEF domain-containing protein